MLVTRIIDSYEYWFILIYEYCCLNGIISKRKQHECKLSTRCRNAAYAVKGNCKGTSTALRCKIKLQPIRYPPLLLLLCNTSAWRTLMLLL